MCTIRDEKKNYFMHRTCLFVLFLLVQGNWLLAQSLTPTITGLQGCWVSLQDSHYHIHFDGDFVLETYVSETYIESVRVGLSKKSCDGGISTCKADDCWFLTKTDLRYGDVYCYGVTNFSRQFLTLVYEGGRILDYKRCQSSK